MNSFQDSLYTSHVNQLSIYQCQALWRQQNELHQSTTEPHQSAEQFESIMPNNSATCL